jgi:hypothetical protein
MSYATVEELRAYLSQVGTTTGDTEQLQDVLDRATDMIDQALGFAFAAYPGSATTKTITHTGGSTLYLPPHQAGTVTVVTDPWADTITSTYYAEDDHGNLYTTAENYPYGAHGGVVGLFAPGRYVVTAKWGHGPAPASIVEVCLELAVNIWRGKDRGMWTETIGVDGEGGLRFTGGMTSQQRSILRAAKYNASGRRAIA